MKSSKAEILPIIGTSMGGGFYAGRIRIDNSVFALIAAPKAEGEKDASEWIAKYRDVPGAKSYCDGLANTMAMAEEQSKLAIWVQALRIGGNDDWYGKLIGASHEHSLPYIDRTPRERMHR